MSKKNQLKKENNLEGVESALTRTEQFIEDNQKFLTYIILGVLVIVSGYIGFQRFIISPKEKEALSVMYVAEQYFQKDSFNLALNGDGNNYGFLDIINDYKLTKSGNLAHYYAGLCYLHTGDYENAISELKKFKSDDYMVGPIALGALGDCYVELGDLTKAVSYYDRAATKNENEFTSPIYYNKAAQLYEKDGNYKKAIELYELIKEKYPKSQEGRTAEKFITRAKLELNK